MTLLPGRPFPPAGRFVVTALAVARTPDVALPELDDYPLPTREEAERFTLSDLPPVQRGLLMGDVVAVAGREGVRETGDVAPVLVDEVLKGREAHDGSTVCRAAV